ncbi:MAG: hypothetical protein ACQEQF_00860 [Bacillota bacterium]
MKYNLLPSSYNKQSNIKEIIFYIILTSVIIFAIIPISIKFKNYRLLKEEYKEISLLIKEVNKYEELFKNNKDIYLKSREVDFNWGFLISDVIEKFPKKMKLEKISLINNSLFLEIDSKKEDNIFLLVDKLKENKKIKEILLNSKGRDKIEIKF